jgi:hypothetical protein
MHATELGENNNQMSVLSNEWQQLKERNEQYM